jgi:MFS family permease
MATIQSCESHQLGFTSSIAQLLMRPIYFCGGVASYITGRLADKFKWRFPFIAGPSLAIYHRASCAILAHNEGQREFRRLYISIILAQSGTYPLLPCISAWTGYNLAPSWRRSIGLAWTLAAGNIGSLIGTNIFLDHEASRYATGYDVSLGIICLGVATTLALELSLKARYKSKETVDRDEVRQRYTDEQLHKLRDKSPLFNHML